MSWWRLPGGRRRDLDDEIEAHLRMAVRDRVERGESLAEAQDPPGGVFPGFGPPGALLEQAAAREERRIRAPRRLTRRNLAQGCAGGQGVSDGLAGVTFVSVGGRRVASFAAARGPRWLPRPTAKMTFPPAGRPHNQARTSERREPSLRSTSTRVYLAGRDVGSLSAA